MFSVNRVPVILHIYTFSFIQDERKLHGQTKKVESLPQYQKKIYIRLLKRAVRVTTFWRLKKMSILCFYAASAKYKPLLSYFIAHRLTAVVYHDFLGNVFPELLQNVDLQTRVHLWFTHDVVSLIYPLGNRAFLINVFPRQWIGRGGSTAWTARSRFNPSRTKRRPRYLKTQSVPRCKHFSSRL